MPYRAGGCPPTSTRGDFSLIDFILYFQSILVCAVPGKFLNIFLLKLSPSFCKVIYPRIHRPNIRHNTMKDQNKTKAQLINELAELRRRLATLETDSLMVAETLKEREASIKSILKAAPIGIGLVHNRVLN